jgi:hypothetical protein
VRFIGVSVFESWIVQGLPVSGTPNVTFRMWRIGVRRYSQASYCALLYLARLLCIQDYIFHTSTSSSMLFVFVYRMSRGTALLYEGLDGGA